MREAVAIPPFPAPLYWQVPPVQWTGTEESLTAVAGAVTDLFIDPQGAAPMLNAPRLFGAIDGEFQFSARVTVQFAGTFDAGVLALWADDHRWAKLCFEYSPQRQPMIVSVVTRGISDDANSFVVDGNQAWLRISRVGAAFAFHASRDGRTWEFIRHFSLGAEGPVLFGFLAQSPTGDGCTVVFDHIRVVPERLQQLRTGE